MGYKIEWQSQKGDYTEDNRDYCGVGLRHGDLLCVVTDGSSSCPTSGLLAKKIIKLLLDWFIETDCNLSKNSIIKQMHKIHDALSYEFPFDSAAYLITIFKEDKSMLIFHAGDCLLGEINNQSKIDWLTQPHTLANAIHKVPIVSLMNMPTRHSLTRSFRPKEFVVPETNEIMRLSGNVYICATDGFWANSNIIAQTNYIKDKCFAKNTTDDASALTIYFDQDLKEVYALSEDSNPNNFYIRDFVGNAEENKPK